MSKERKIEDKDLSKITGGATTTTPTTNFGDRATPDTLAKPSEGGETPNNPGGPENQAPGGGTSNWSPS